MSSGRGLSFSIGQSRLLRCHSCVWPERISCPQSYSQCSIESISSDVRTQDAGDWTFARGNRRYRWRYHVRDSSVHLHGQSSEYGQTSRCSSLRRWQVLFRTTESSMWRNTLYDHRSRQRRGDVDPCRSPLCNTTSTTSDRFHQHASTR